MYRVAAVRSAPGVDSADVPMPMPILLPLLATAPFWGTPTSSVDWCEANYAHTPYVCELFNTVSSLAMLAAGLAGLWLHRRVLERRFMLAFVALAVVGAGSIAFHATLLFQMQMLDELPMLYLALILV